MIHGRHILRPVILQGSILGGGRFARTRRNVPPVLTAPAGGMYPGNVVASTKAGQWYRGGVALAGEVGNSLTLPRTVNPGDLITQAGSNALAIGGYDYANGDADASTIIAAVLAAGGAVEFGGSAASRSNNKWAMAALFRAMKQGGLWALLPYFRILAGTNTLAGGLAAGRGGSATNVNFVTGDIATTAGWKGDGTTKRITTSWAGNATPQDNWSVWVHVTQPVTTGDNIARRIIGNGISSAGAILVGKSSGEPDGYSTRGKTAAAGAPTGTPSTGTGLLGVSRTGSTGYSFRRSGVDVAVSQASDGNTSNPLAFFSDGAASYADCRIAAILYGNGLNSTQRAALDAALASYLTDLLA